MTKREWFELSRRRSNKIRTRVREGETGKQPAYAGCTYAPEWGTAKGFLPWLKKHYVEGWQIDKDFLIAGNKHYGPDTCVFIPQFLNSAFTSAVSIRGAHPLGVFKDTRVKNRKKPYRARISHKGEEIRLGHYATPHQAHQAWQKAKAQEIQNTYIPYYREACKQARKRPDARIIQAMRDVRHDILCDLAENVETTHLL